MLVLARLAAKDTVMVIGECCQESAVATLTFGGYMDTFTTTTSSRKSLFFVKLESGPNIELQYHKGRFCERVLTELLSSLMNNID